MSDRDPVLPIVDTGPNVGSGLRCRHLLSKGLYVNHGLPPGEEAVGDGYFWCGQTQGQLGPDRKICDREDCSTPSRGCYEPY